PPRMAGVGEPLLPRPGVPDANGVVRATDGGQQTSIGAKCHLVVHAGYSAQNQLFLAGRQVPDLHEQVGGASRQPLAVWAEGNLCNRPGPVREVQGLLVGRYVPDPHGIVLTGRNQPPAVGTERHATYISGMSAQGADLAELLGGRLG